MSLGKSLYPALGAALAAVLIVTPLDAAAQSACKGLEQSACTDQSACTWVGGYTRSSGAQVAGYCRSKGNRSAKAATDKAATETVGQATTAEDGQ